MKKLSLILVALATLVMVGCKPLTGSTVCTHNWVDTDDTKVTSAKYYEVSEGVYNLEKVEVSPKYKCSICGEEHDKTIAFFTTDDHKTTIDVATDVSYDDFEEIYWLPIDEELTVFYNNQFIEQTERYLVYLEAIKNKNEAWEKYQEINNKYIGLGIEWSERWNCEDFKAASNEYSAADRRCEELDPIKCNCGGDCVGNCGGSTCRCDKLTCVRIIHNTNNDMYFFGDYYITVPNN